MVKKKKRGFVFVETIVVISVILTSLITIYSLYILSDNLTMRRLRYDDVNKLYESYYIQKYLSSFGMYNLMNRLQNGSMYEQIYRGRQDLFGSKLTNEAVFFETLWEDLKVKSIILVPFDVSNIIKCNKVETEGLCADETLIDYMKTLDVDGSSGYRLIFEFASTLEGGSCPNLNECFYFYTNIRIDGV